MGRELRRKQSKIEGKSLKREINNNDDNEVQNFVKISIILIILCVVIYLLIGIFITKEIKWFGNNSENDVVDTVSNNIIASAIFKQKEEDYYVYFYNFEETNSNIESTISNKLSDYKVYRVDTSSSLNQNYVSEDSSNPNAKNLEELKVKAPTLIKIINDQIASYYETENGIINGLN